MRILSGIQPSGSMHIGNYLGAVRQWVDSQNPDAYYCIVDLHALTLQIEPADLREQTRGLPGRHCWRRASIPTSAPSSSRARSPITPR